MRYRLGYDRVFCDDVLGTFMDAWMAEQRVRAKRLLSLASVTQAHPGALLFVQRFDSALRLNVHAHVLGLDGVYVEDSGGVRFETLPEPTTADLERIVQRMLGKLKERWGDELGVGDHEVAESSAMASCYAASLQNQDLFGARAGKPTLRVVGPQPTPSDATSRLKVRIQGFDLDAQVAFDGRDRKRLERMVRYLARPALSNERLTKMADGRIRVAFKQAWSDGTASILLSPKDLIARLAALVPPPKFHLLPVRPGRAVRKLRRLVGSSSPSCSGHPQALPASASPSATVGAVRWRGSSKRDLNE